MGSQGAIGKKKVWCCIVASVAENHSTVILIKQAQIVLLIILLVAIVNTFAGMFIYPTEDKKSKGVFNYNGKKVTRKLRTRSTKDHLFYGLVIVAPPISFFLSSQNLHGEFCT